MDNDKIMDSKKFEEFMRKAKKRIGKNLQQRLRRKTLANSLMYFITKIMLKTISTNSHNNYHK